MAKGGDVLVKRLPSSRVSAMSAANENGPVHSDGAVALSGAGDGTRTRGYQLGKLGPYHLATPALSEHYTATSSSTQVILENPHEASARPVIREMTVKACMERRGEPLQPQLLFSPPLHGEQDGNEALALLR